ncbi:DUF3592 domain-containing protein [Amycolatopsis rhabdoformis]|uniref:DUF3592 domain-containing protein n=1 Tax=Amycolatopsis rhabdoformis TaxID=1448059 RepID=A0ABZ1I895_9PSEU|nr:DUF3592 domain-containing protein [Amycolatopsis rhabdoformis]WSE30646.1 DUF3592 domain-containing protein [Amycolatopsis rhabdoformis]
MDLGTTDSATWDRVLRRQYWRSVCLVVVFGLVLPALLLTGLWWQDNRSTWLLDHGDETTGQVTRVRTSSQGHDVPTISIAYQAHGAPEQVDIDGDSGRDYRVGDSVTVLFDPADPTHARTPDEQNLSDGWMLAFVIPLLLLIVFVPVTIVAAVTWARRRRAAGASTWRPVRLRTSEDTDHGQTVRFTLDGRQIVAKPTVLSFVPRGKKRRAGAHVAGSGRRLVLVLPTGSRRGRPRAVALKVRAKR